MCKHSKSRIKKVAIGIGVLVVAGSLVWFAGRVAQQQALLNIRLNNIEVELDLLKQSIQKAESQAEEKEVDGLKIKSKESVREIKVEEIKQERVQEPVLVGQETGNCHLWMEQAGILDQASAYTLIMRESGCNPNAVNRYSGACGIGQQLPCGKWSHTWNDPVGGMIDMQDYVIGRYGSWANALAFSNANGWY